MANKLIIEVRVLGLCYVMGDIAPASVTQVLTLPIPIKTDIISMVCFGGVMVLQVGTNNANKSHTGALKCKQTTREYMLN